MTTTAYFKNNFVYLRLPKNGSTTFRTILQNDGWQEFNLFENNIDLNKCTIFGHITNPENRHTKGLSTFLDDNPDIDIDDPSIGKLLVSGVFEAHTYSIHMTLGHLINLYQIHWIPLDVDLIDYKIHPHSVLNGNDLTNNFFKEHNLNLTVTDSDRRWVKQEEHKEIREKIKLLKIKYEKYYLQLVKHILEPDILLYNRVVDEYRKKYY